MLRRLCIWLVLKLGYVAFKLPEFDIMTINKRLRFLDRGLVVLAVQTHGLDEMAVSADTM